MAEKTVCMNQVDYAQVQGERILPFVFTLDTEASVLNPGPGEKQKFCYVVEGMGQDEPRFADLSHFLLGICSAITAEDIAAVTVVVDGVEQEVVFGENVEIKTAEKPDPPTGCVGLKFDFGLDKVEGVMEVCFTLNRTFGVGPVNVCVFGGNVTATGLAICGPVCNGPVPCTTTFFQNETVCVPVTVTPFATPGEASATCCGRPVVTSDGQCQGSRKSCTFTIRQRLCIEIPISFGADVVTGEAVVQCGEVTETPCDCTDTPTVSQPAGSPAENTDSEENRRGRRYFAR